MSQLQKTCSITNGSQAVAIPGDVSARILKNHVFMVVGELTPYTVAQNSTFDGASTQVVLTGVYQGTTGIAAPCVFVTDYTYPNMLPVIAQGDVGTAAIFTDAMYKVQRLITVASPTGLVDYQNVATAIDGKAATIAANKAAVDTALAVVVAANTSATGAATSATASATTATAAKTDSQTALAAANASKALSTTAAAAAATSASSAAAAAATATQAASALTLALAQFRAVFIGSRPTDPTVDGNGNALVDGAEYFNTTTNLLMLRSGGVWVTHDSSTGSTTSASISATNAAASAASAATSATAAATSQSAMGAVGVTSAANAASALASMNAAAASAASATATQALVAGVVEAAAASALTASNAATASTNSQSATAASATAAAGSAVFTAASAVSSASSAANAAASATSVENALVATATNATAAQASATSAATSATAASGSAASAATSATAASSSATAAASSLAAVATNATNATNAATNAATSATGAAASAAAAAASKSDVAALATTILNSQNSATASAASANTASANADTSKNAASASATSAVTSALSATASATSAATSATAATTQAGIATTQATNASTSASAAGISAGIANAASNAATTQAANASASASSAVTSASSAAGSATTAATQSQVSSAQAVISTAQAVISAARSADASASATSASDSLTKAQLWADQTQNVQVETGRYSAKHWALTAQASATGSVIYRGLFSAAAGTYPPTPHLGDYYVIDVGGVISSISYVAGDSIIYNGATWDKTGSGSTITSVNGQTGIVVVTKTNVGLANVDNISDAAKPVSTAQATAIALKEDSANLAAVARSGSYNDLANKPAAYVMPVAAGAVLGGVKSSSSVLIDAAGIATVTLTSIGAKASSYTPAWGELTGKPTTLSGFGITDAQAALGFTPYNATNPSNFIAASGAPVQSVGGFAGAITKTQLAINNLDNTADINKPVSTAQATADAAIGAAAATDATTKANAAQTAAIAASAPIAHVGSSGTSHAIVTTTTPGFASAADKIKLDAISGSNTGDETLATIKTKLGVTTLSGSNTGDQVIPTTLPASDVYAWAKASIKPVYAASEVGSPSGSGTSSGTNTGDQTNITGSAGSLAATNWTIAEVAGVLYFKYGGVNKAKLDSSGNFTCLANVLGYTAP